MKLSFGEFADLNTFQFDHQHVFDENVKGCWRLEGSEHALGQRIENLR